MRTEVFFSPLATTSAARGSAVNASMTGRGSRDAARTSTSPTVSRIRRRDPACAQRSTCGSADSASTTSSATPAAASSSTRSREPRISSMPRRMFSSVFGPKPFSPRSRPARIAASSSSTDDTPSSSYRTRAFFGPSVGIAVSALTPAGIRARSSSTCRMVPVRV